MSENGEEISAAAETEPRSNRAGWGEEQAGAVTCCIQALFEFIFTAMESYLWGSDGGVT